MSYALVKNEAETSAFEDGSSTHVPGGWDHLRLDELYQISMGTTLLAASTQEKPKQGYIPVYSATEKDHYFGYVLATTVKNVLREGDIVVPARGTIGSPKYVSLMAASTQTTIQMRPRGEINKYNFYYIKHHRDLLFPVLPGTIPQLTVANVSRSFILVPPLAEQTAIANILSDQEALIAQYDNLIALHEKRFAYLSDELLSGRLNLQKNEKGLTIGEGPTDNWLKSTVKNAVSIFNGYPCSSTQMSDDFVNGVPILKMSNIEDGAIVLLEQGSQKYFVDPLRLESVPQKNDMLVGLSGSVGKSGVFGVKAKCIVNQRIAILRVKDANFDQDFFNFMWVWCLIDALLKNVQSSTIGNVSTKDVEELSFSHPPLEEQTLIANVLSDQEALIAQYKKLRDAEKKRFDWLSDALLSGTYRVKVEA